jgi:hypothetical protein
MAYNRGKVSNESPFEQYGEHGEVRVSNIRYLFCVLVHSVWSPHPLPTVVNIKENVFLGEGGYEGVVSHLKGKT